MKLQNGKIVVKKRDSSYDGTMAHERAFLNQFSNAELPTSYASRNLTPIRGSSNNNSALSLSLNQKTTPPNGVQTQLNHPSRAFENPVILNKEVRFDKSLKKDEIKKFPEERDFQIKKTSGSRSNSRLRSPGAFTGVGCKSGVSMFTGTSGTTTMSAPIPGMRAQSANKKRSLDERKKRRAKKKLSNLANKSQQSFYKSQDNFFVNTQPRNGSQGPPKKIIPLQKVKFPTNGKPSGLPKPPSSLKFASHGPGQYNSIDTQILSSTEKALKLADEGLASIDQHLKSKKSIPKIKIASKQADHPMQANINLSFNNHKVTLFKQKFDVVDNSVSQPAPQVLAFSQTPQAQSMKKISDQEEAQLDQQLTNRLIMANDNEKEQLKAFNQTFDEIIRRDKHFGNLLNKIKKAYEDYMRKHMDSELTSPIDSHRIKELQSRIEQLDHQLSKERRGKEQVESTQNDIMVQNQRLKEENQDLAKQCETLTQQLATKSTPIIEQSVKGQHVVRQSNTDTSLRSLDFSKSSNRTNIPGQTPMLKEKGSSRKLKKEVQALLAQNSELSQTVGHMDEDIKYLKLREQKIMYFIFVLSQKGYPVDKIFAEEIKPIPTEKFAEGEEFNQDEGADQPPNYSFHSDDSFEPILAAVRDHFSRPDNVPKLNLRGLPDYESSSDEEDVQNNEQQNYQQSMNYINDFYNRLNGGTNSTDPVNQNLSSDFSRDVQNDGIVEDFDA